MASKAIAVKTEMGFLSNLNTQLKYSQQHYRVLRPERGEHDGQYQKKSR